MKPILYYLVGLPASGKSTWAKNMMDNNTILLSSDNLREELYGDINNQEHNGELFNELNKRVKENLKNGKDIIYDATNISSKRRISFLKELKKINCHKQCIYFNTNFEMCIDRDKKRKRKVGTKVIEKMYKNLQIPMYFEGWDDISIWCYDNGENNLDININYDYGMYCSLLDEETYTRNCIERGQDNPYHILNMSRHMYYAYDWIKRYTDNKYLIFATLIHDIGKPYTKIYKDKYAHYYGHENISAQLCIRLLKEKTNLTNNEIIKIATYIQLHMRLLNLNESDKGKEKFRNLVGEELFNDLVLLHNADTQAK